MNQITRLIFSFSLTIVVIVIVTWIASGIVRHSSPVATRKATETNILFIVCIRRWASIMIRTLGIVVIVVGLFLVLASTTDNGTEMLGMDIAGVIMAIAGAFFVWLAHGMTRLRLEVTTDTVWVFPLVGAPRKVLLSEVAKLAPLVSNNYGGIVARSNTRKLFYASRIMLGYPQLIEYLQTRRPDLAIPDESLPLQS